MLLGVDVGGTFTDAALIAGDRLVTAKAPSTPDDQSRGVIDAVEAALEQASASAGDVERFVHGMTVGTNALLEGKVAKTALLATEGFTDLEELGRQARADLYRLCVGHPPAARAGRAARGRARTLWARGCAARPRLRGASLAPGRPSRRRRVRRGVPALGLSPPRPRAGRGRRPRRTRHPRVDLA